ncbi:MAG: tRNA (adenosine(37)-N6)-dimethylallyltransferase MiaA [Proteobacteria bacterium]|nr:tRNA (adenosine(37)-N6)-dimethylallyltransferase MiaA [Pseudomonadota bacterium]
MTKPRVVAIVGPTASGKSALAVELALKLNAEIIGADSMQVYRYMDIGTAKPTVEERQGVLHHMIDIVNPDEEFSVSDYREMASGVIKEIHGRGKTVIIAGGSGLYLRALTKGLVDTPEGDSTLREELNREAEEKGREYVHEKLKSLDPISAERIHPNNIVRVIRALEVAIKSEETLSEIQAEHAFGESPYEVMMVGIDVDRDSLYKRIEERVDRMMAAGLKKEVETLLDMGYDRHLKPMRGVGYKEMCAHILDGLPLIEAVELIKRDSRRYAKRQMTWFRKEDVTWNPFDNMKNGDLLNEIKSFLKD